MNSRQDCEEVLLFLLASMHDELLAGMERPSRGAVHAGRCQGDGC